jgi:hypothetical protein
MRSLLSLHQTYVAQSGKSDGVLATLLVVSAM